MFFESPLIFGLYITISFDQSPTSRIITIQSSPDKPDKEEEEVATLTREEAASGLAIGSATDSGVNLYILAGHEAMQL